MKRATKTFLVSTMSYSVTSRVLCEWVHRDFSRFSEDRTTHTEYGFEAVTSVCAGKNPKIPKFQNVAGLDGGRATHSGRSYALGSCSNDQLRD